MPEGARPERIELVEERLEVGKREEDGVLIVPVLEEQLVVTTRLVLKEELRITRKSRTETIR
jgi:stress response protein YsnF